MKTRQKILLTALSAALIATMTSGLTLTALADEATKDHEFDAKTDVVFEDFDRETISDTVKAEGDHADLGEKPYLRVKYTAGNSTTPGDAIYKQGSGSLAEVSSGGTITLKMRAPEGDVKLSEIKFGVRGVDNDAAVLAKTLDQLTDSDSESLPELTAQWQEYEISFATSYENSDIYPTTTNTTVAGTPLLAIHLYAADASATGTLDIASVSYSKTGGNVIMNDFRGGDTVEPTAKLADSGTWWAGSSEGYIVKRAVKLTANGSFTVVKGEAVGDYKYAVIETEGDKENLKVATTTDGTAWGDLTPYDGYSVALKGTEKGFKFSYDGSVEGGVTVRRIYLTNNVKRAPATAAPVFDASSAQVLEDFSFAQKGFTDVYEDMSTVEGLADAGLDYRLSYSNGSLVEVKEGCLVFDASTLAAEGYINFKFKSKGTADGKYVIFKMKGEGDATLDGFRFALGDPDDKYTDIIWANSFNAAYGFKTPLLTADNPYTEGDWYYVVIDIEESGYKVSEAGYSGMDLYYGGTGKLYIDTVFFADKLPDVVQDLTADGVETNDVTDYTYAGGFALDNKYGTATAFSFDITPKGDDFSPDNLRLEMGGGPYWGSENTQGTLITTEGKKLNELTYTKDVATHIEIDIAASGIGAFEYVHVHTNNMGGFKLDNIKLHTETPKENFKELSQNVVTVEKTFTAAPTAEQTDYTYIDGADIAYNRYGKLEFTLTPGVAFNGTELRVEIKNGNTSVKQIWIAQQNDAVITADGKKYSEIVFKEGEPVNFVFDLIALGADAAVNQFHVHSTGIKTGPFTIDGVKLTALQNNYAEELEKLSAYLDTVKPEVHITTPTTAKAGDEIEIAYTASDDVTAEDDLDVTVLVVKDGKTVTLEQNKFQAEEGVYTVTVTVRDANGNEATDTIQITVSGEGGNTPGGTPGGDPGTPGEQTKGLSTGAIVGIVIGVLAGIALIGVIAYTVVKKKKH